MYVVIPVADEPSNDTLELAVASIHAHTPYDVLTIGKDFGVAEHIHHTQTRDPWANTDNAMRIACDRLETFIWSADDIYWTRPAEPVRWALGRLGTTIRRGHYGRRKDATRDWLQSHHLPIWDYESHTPMPIDSTAMLEALTIIQSEPALDKRSIYGNLTGEPDVIADDVKIREAATTIPNTPWVSDHDYSPMREQLRAYATTHLVGTHASL